MGLVLNLVFLFPLSLGISCSETIFFMSVVSCSQGGDAYPNQRSTLSSENISISQSYGRGLQNPNASNLIKNLQHRDAWVA